MTQPSTKGLWAALLLSSVTQAQLSDPIAMVTNTGFNTVAMNTGGTTIMIPAGQASPARSGDIVFVLARSTATVRYTDDCEIAMTGNQRLVLSTLEESCARRKAAIVTTTPDQKADSTAKQVSPGAGAPGEAVTLGGLSATTGEETPISSPAGEALPPLSSAAAGIAMGAGVIAAFIYVSQTSSDNGGDRGNISPDSF